MIEIKLAALRLRSKDSVFSDYQKESDLHAYALGLSPKGYYTDARALYFGAFVGAFVFQALSAVSGYSALLSEFAPKLPNPIASVSATVLALVLLEFAKHAVGNGYFKGVFAIPKAAHSLALLFVFAAISALSAWLSVRGGGALVKDDKAPEIVAGEYAAKISAIQGEIVAIQARNTYKGQTYLPKKELALLHAKEAEIQTLKSESTAKLASIDAANKSAETRGRIGFAVFELCFIGCTLFVWHYRKRSAIEFLAQQPESIGPISENSHYDNRINENRTGGPTQPHQAPRIGFTFGANPQSKVRQEPSPETLGTRHCKHCGTPYTHKHHKQLYCTEPCRIAAYEQRTGRTLTKGRKS